MQKLYNLKFLISAGIFVFVLATSCAQKREIVWKDNFDASSLNEENWNYELGDGCPNLCGWGNNEPQIYTKTNHELKDGFLVITAKKEGSQITSTRITTKDKFEFKYGRVEARAKLPKGQGIWAAFWMLGANISDVGWPMAGEVDILEYVGKEPDSVFTTIHTKSSYGNTINTKKTFIKNIEEGFHTFAADWTPEKIDFLVDGEILYTYQPKVKTEETWPFNKDCYILINLAVGGNLGGPEIDESNLPQEFIIDYVRVYKN